MGHSAVRSALHRALCPTSSLELRSVPPTACQPAVIHPAVHPDGSVTQGGALRHHEASEGNDRGSTIVVELQVGAAASLSGQWHV